MSFGSNAARLAGLAGVLFGWRPEDFWQATPDELAALLGAVPSPERGPDAHQLARLKDIFPDG